LTSFFRIRRILINLQGLNTITIGKQTSYRENTPLGRWDQPIKPVEQDQFVLINKTWCHLHSKFETLDTTLVETGKEI